jgi:ribosomal protein S18 acetylase RimI-like enzyme
MDSAVVVELAEGQRQRALATLVAAFIADPVERWLYPEASDYLTHFGRFIEASAGGAFEARTAWALDDVAAVALWLPPGMEPDGDAVVRVLTETVATAKHTDMLAVLEQMEAAHPTYPHWYLALLGVDPSRQGLGMGSRLLEAGLRTVDEAHLPAYLETPNPQTVGLYERYGFVVSGRLQAGSCPPIVSMVRAPR